MNRRGDRLLSRWLSRAVGFRRHRDGLHRRRLLRGLRALVVENRGAAARSGLSNGTFSDRQGVFGYLRDFPPRRHEGHEERRTDILCRLTVTARLRQISRQETGTDVASRPNRTGLEGTGLANRHASQVILWLLWRCQWKWTVSFSVETKSTGGTTATSLLRALRAFVVENRGRDQEHLACP